jgi:hypothetical protein
MTSSIDREQLRRLALAATEGPWEADQAQPWVSGMGPFDDWGASVTTQGTVIIQGGAQDEQGGAVGVLLNEDAAYIAAANPQVLLTLLTELDSCDQALAATEHLQQLSESHLREMAALINQLDQAEADASRMRQALKDLVHTIMTGTIISLDGMAVYTIRHDSATLKIAHHIVLESQS